jgi:hypothetical protein
MKAANLQNEFGDPVITSVNGNKADTDGKLTIPDVSVDT